MAADCETWRAISRIEAPSSSAEAATTFTLPDIWCAAAATWVARPSVRAAVSVMEVAVPCSSSAACARVWVSVPTLPSKSSTRAARVSARRCRAACSCASAVARRSARMPFCLNTSTASAIAPISSRFSRPGTSTAQSPCASRVIAPVIPRTGRKMLRATSTAKKTPASRHAVANTSSTTQEFSIDSCAA